MGVSLVVSCIFRKFLDIIMTNLRTHIEGKLMNAMG